EREPGGVDEDVDAVQLVGRGFRKALAAARIPHVQLQSCQRRLDPLDAPRTPDDTCSLPGEEERGRRADAAGRAGDDGRLSFQARHRESLTTERSVARNRFAQLDRRARGLGMLDL